ncbi:M20/M25/M40 family metallo-hydrolase [Candidatus Solincola tengchongensis]|uniref:M28 family metallopeptidase n=1 Tax=Candidatus Solincola tengchongensis TaxID=2900693 RepID=UPI00257D071E|nr:M20/M25/M40 family metallo-hydrolase [Candidatus Solincola tengchongensis]
MGEAERYAEYMHKLVDRVMREIGPRESCSEEERRLGRLFAEEVGEACSEVRVEEFTCSPKAFLGFFPFLVAGYLAALVLYYVLPPISLIITSVCVGILFFEVVRYREFIDFLFPRRKGENVIGVIPPEGERRKRLIISAHLDSAYEFKVWYWLKGLAVPAMVLAFTGPLVLLAASLARTVAGSTGMPDSTAFRVLGYICIAFVPVVLPFAVFHTRDVVPGAMDDMAGVSVLCGLARYLREARERGGFRPRQTEVLLVAMSAEEAGLRGAKRYAARHRREFMSIPTYAVFLDGIYDEKYLTAFKRELWCGATMDPYLVDLAREAARDNGYPMKVTVMLVGATDGSAFARAGIPSISICCQDTSRLVPHYHTRLDTIENVRPESLATTLQLVIDMLRKIDGG